MTSTDPTFRVYPPEPFVDDDGRPMLMQVCEDLIDGHWEPFLSTYPAQIGA